MRIGLEAAVALPSTQRWQEAFDHAQRDVESGAASSATTGVVIERAAFDAYYAPLIHRYISDREQRGIERYVVGIQGCQGSGKTVITTFIQQFLRALGFSVVGFSIDDFYKSFADRERLYELHNHNPFYAVRGLPGTHRYRLLREVLEKIKAGQPFDLPHFDKSLHGGKGDISDTVTSVTEEVDFAILEGWCVGVPYVTPQRFAEIMASNSYVSGIFDELDPEHAHVAEVMRYVKDHYKCLWRFLDKKTILLGEDIRLVEQWRVEQEQRLRATRGEGMSDDEVRRFIRPYIPLAYLIDSVTRGDERRNDSILTIGPDHRPNKLYLPIS